MTNFQTDYHALGSDENEPNRHSVVIHVASEGSKTKWNHIADLDGFFRAIYTFHQKGGYFCILAEHIQSMLMFTFIAFGFVYTSHCIYFNFVNLPPNPNANSVHFSDLFIPINKCAANYFGFWAWLMVVFCFIGIFYLIIKLLGTARYYRFIQQFYETAMKIPRGDIQNVTWHDVQCKLREVQHEQQMCVNSTDLTDLDISHRILRNKNYMVAMVNKSVLPLKYNVKFLGDWTYFPSSLESVLYYLFFTGSYSPFGGSGRLREEFKRREERLQCAESLRKHIFIFCVLSILFFPFMWAYQILSFLVSYSGYLRYEPGFMMLRTWSPYAKLNLRHFNELDHELEARLGRAYKLAKLYMRSFNSPLVRIVVRFLLQIVGFLVVFLSVWTFAVEQLLVLSHVTIGIFAGAFVFQGLYTFQQDQNEVFFPNELMQGITSEVHYIPDHFKSLAHTSHVRDSFAHYFQYKLALLLEEIISPLANTYVMWQIRHRSLEIVDFFRNFTVHVDGVGDVCSFALMDVSKHGNRQWFPHTSVGDAHNQAEGGKTELSAIHFAMMNPHWQPPLSTQTFINDFKQKVNTAKQEPGTSSNAFYTSLNSLGSRYDSLARSMDRSQYTEQASSRMSPIGRQERYHARKLTKAEGPSYYVQDSLLPSITGESMDGTQIGLNPIEARAADMSISALFLHEVHDTHMTTSTRLAGDPRSEGDIDVQNEDSPLLSNKLNFVQ